MRCGPLHQNSEYNNSYFLAGIINSSNNSLFTYPSDQSYATFYDPLFSPMFEPSFEDAELENEAKTICGDDTFCLFDVAATKNIEIGVATMNGGENFDAIVEMAVPSKFINT